VGELFYITKIKAAQEYFSGSGGLLAICKKCRLRSLEVLAPSSFPNKQWLTAVSKFK
jgi:hypothetical protein